MMMLRVLAAAVFLSCLVAAGANAGDNVNQSGKFSIWVPDQWKVTQEGNRIRARNPRDTIEVLAGPLPDTDADLVDEDVADFVDDEIDDMKITKDDKTKLGSLDARILEGEGTDEGDDIIFRALALDPGGTAAVIEVVVYGDDDIMDTPDIKRVVERILRSLKPI